MEYKDIILYSTHNRGIPSGSEKSLTGDWYENAVFNVTSNLGYGELEFIGDTKQTKNKKIVLQNQPHSIYSEEIQTKFATAKTFKGKFCLFIGFFLDHYGHNLHDNIQVFQMLKNTLPDDTLFLIPKHHDILKNMLIAIDSEWNNKFVEYDEKTPTSIIGKTYFICHAKNKLPHSAYHLKDYRDELRKTLNRSEKITNQEHIIFCPRINDNKHGRSNSNEQIIEIENLIKSVCETKNVNAKISTFYHEQYKTISEQKNFFKDSTIILGLHGTALTNMIWSDRFSSYTQKPLQIIEGIGLSEAYKNYSDFQNGNDDGYYRLFAEGFNVKWRHFFYHPINNKFNEVYIDLKNIENALVDSLTSEINYV